MTNPSPPGYIVITYLHKSAGWLLGLQLSTLTVGFQQPARTILQRIGQIYPDGLGYLVLEGYKLLQIIINK